jgi:folate-binding protein YgfZ
MNKYNWLKNRAVVKVVGVDSFKFLQGILTNDVNKLLKDQAIYACLLTPQGKYFADFFLYLVEDGVLMDLCVLRKEEILKKLKMYKLRSDVDFIDLPEYKVVSSFSVSSEGAFFKDPRSSSLGMRGFVKEGNLEENDEYDLVRIANFIAEGDKDLIPEQSFLLEYGFDDLNAIDYKKGCYVGQELIARTHYRGEIRKQVVQIQAIDKLPALGTIIYRDEKKLGIVCSSVNNLGLALIRTEDVESLNENEKITADGKEVKLIFKGNK